MVEIDRTKLSELYPKAKTYDELKRKRLEIAELRRPKLVALKASSYITSGLLAILLTFNFIAMLTGGNMSSAGDVLALVCASILLGLICMAMIIYFYLSVMKLMNVVLVSTAPFSLAIFGLLIITGIALSFVIRSTSDNFLYIAGVLVASFLLVFATTQGILVIQTRS